MSDRFNMHSRVLEVLLHKAVVDDTFKAKLLEQREAAARELGLELSPMETALLATIPQAQLEGVIAQTEVPEESRRIFMGQVAAAMLAVLGIGATGCLHPKAAQVEPAQPAGPAQPAKPIGADQVKRDPYANIKGIDPLRSTFHYLFIYFDTNSAKIPADQEEHLAEIIRMINLPAYRDRKIKIIGHTDERGAQEYNLQLGERRAMAVRDYLISKGIPAARLSIASEGENHPIDNRPTREGRARNRRVEFQEDWP